MPDTAITGASGLVGGDLLKTLVDRGESCRAIVRSEASAQTVASLGATPVVADLFDHDAMRDALWGAEVLYHVAGVNETCARDSSAMDSVNIDATRSVIRAAAAGGVGRIVYTSSAAAIGENQGIVANEDIVNNGEYLSPYARSKHPAEIAAFEEASEVGIDLVAVNPSSVQGPGRSGGSAKILLYVLRSRRPVLTDSFLSIVDIGDCTAGHIAAADRGRAGERYLLSGAALSVRDAVDLAQRVSGASINPRWVSEGVVRMVSRPASRFVNLVKPDAGLCPALIDTLLHGHRFDGSRAERDLGVVYTPISDTFTRTIEWFRSEALIS
ncbi:MAG: NAD-dependent epimerase/dehydratase family protein [Acidimicrobiia bacterium]